MAMNDVAPDSFAIILAHLRNPDQIGGCLHTLKFVHVRWSSTYKEGHKIGEKQTKNGYYVHHKKSFAHFLDNTWRGPI